MKNRYCGNLITNVIVAIILILYVLFLIMDFYNVKANISTRHIKYLCILLCFLLSILSTKKLCIVTNIDIVNHRDIVLLQFAMFLTVIADLCLVILDFYTIGVVFFCFVQITYCVRYTTNSIETTLGKFFIIFLFIVCLYIIGGFFIGQINILLPILSFYSICLLSSVTKGIKVWKKNLYPSPNKYMIVFGMILFLLCDICVALSNIPVFLHFIGGVMISFQQITSFLIWVFYLPSQLLLSLSGTDEI